MIAPDGRFRVFLLSKRIDPSVYQISDHTGKSAFDLPVPKRSSLHRYIPGRPRVFDPISLFEFTAPFIVGDVNHENSASRRNESDFAKGEGKGAEKLLAELGRELVSGM